MLSSTTRFIYLCQGVPEKSSLQDDLVKLANASEGQVMLCRWSELPADAPVRGLALSPRGNAAVVQRGSAVYLLTW